MQGAASREEESGEETGRNKGYPGLSNMMARGSPAQGMGCVAIGLDAGLCYFSSTRYLHYI